MFDRQTILRVVSGALADRLPAAEIDRIASAIVDQLGEWEEVDLPRNSDGHVSSVHCFDVCCFVHEMEEGGEFRLLRRKLPVEP